MENEVVCDKCGRVMELVPDNEYWCECGNYIIGMILKDYSHIVHYKCVNCGTEGDIPYDYRYEITYCGECKSKEFTIVYD